MEGEKFLKDYYRVFEKVTRKNKITYSRIFSMKENNINAMM